MGKIVILSSRSEGSRFSRASHLTELLHATQSPKTVSCDFNPEVEKRKVEIEEDYFAIETLTYQPITWNMTIKTL